jgi:hypothetical protein
MTFSQALLSSLLLPPNDFGRATLHIFAHRHMASAEANNPRSFH